MSWLVSLSETYDNFYGGAYEQTGDRIVPVRVHLQMAALGTHNTNQFLYHISNPPRWPR